jgi:hypothetical protein
MTEPSPGEAPHNEAIEVIAEFRRPDPSHQT